VAPGVPTLTLDVPTDRPARIEASWAPAGSGGAVTSWKLSITLQGQPVQPYMDLDVSVRSYRFETAWNTTFEFRLKAVGSTGESGVALQTATTPPVPAPIEPTPPPPGVTGFGDYSLGSSAEEMIADRKRVSRFVCEKRCTIVALAIRCDGLGSSPGNALVRGLAYAAGDALGDGTLLGAGEAVTIGDGQEVPQWVQLPMPGIPIEPGEYDLGFIAGGQSQAARAWVTQVATSGGRFNDDDFWDGPSDPFGTEMDTALTADGLSIYALTIPVYEFPVATPLEYARLPFPDAQDSLSGGVQDDPVLRATCGWHGTRIDPDVGSFCVVRRGSALEPLVGSVLRVTLNEGTRPRRVYVYCKAALDLPFDDLSLARRAFMALSYPARDQLRVVVEVVT
jgi:hypothetical protein